MTTEQIQNAIGLCKNQPISSIMRIFSMGLYREPEIQQLAEYFDCNPDKESVAFHLMLGK